MLDVYLYDQHVARLVDAGDGELALQYTNAALAAGNRARLSLSLPVREEPYASRRGGNRWVRSILPEPAMRERVATEFGLEGDDYAGVLMRVGRDVAGAAVIVPEGEPPSTGREIAEEISDEDLIGLVSDLPSHPLGVDRERGVRLSLAGVQEKLVLVGLPDGRWARPCHGYPSTHILKPEPDTYAGLATNELFCLQLATTSGLATSEASIEAIGDTPTLVVARYDRVSGSDLPHRIHQEDMLSALGRDPRHKYEWDDEQGQIGPTMRDFAGVVESHLGRLRLLLLLDVMVFNVIIGNADAHARNLSFLLHRDGTVVIAPLYDLINTRLYDGTSVELSQRINDTFDLDSVSVEDLIGEANAWGISEEVARRRILELAVRTLGVMSTAASATVARGGDTGVVDRIVQDVRTRIQGLDQASG